MDKIYFKLGNKMEYNTNTGQMKTVIIILFLIFFQFPCIAAKASGDVIQLYDSEMLLRDLDNKSGTCIDTQKPLVHTDDKNQATIEVPRSINYNTTLLEEGAKLYRAGKFLSLIHISEPTRPY